MELDDMNNALIISPHPDDETFGCGGLIKQLVSSNKRVSIIFLSRGEGIVNSISQCNPNNIIAEREKLVKAVCVEMGLEYKNVFWLNFPDGNFINTSKTEISKLDRLIKYISPDYIFYPHPWEGSLDHKVGSEIVSTIIRDMDLKKYYYCVWVWYHMLIYRIPFLRLFSSYKLIIDETDKLRMVKIYSEATDCDGNYYSGKLPEVFIKAVSWNKEIYFKA